MVTFVRFLHSRKASLPICVTDVGIIVFIHPHTNVVLFVCIIALQSSLLSYIGLFESTLIEEREEHPQKISLPKLMTDRGIVIACKDVQLKNAQLPISVTDDEMLTFFIDVQPENAYASMSFTDDGTTKLSREEQL